ncbi:MAG TPA: glucan biosynthesis protein G [Verrucomicrobiae bacterium]|nr:glucan biosynthesis protein G [Verrucomicrobiae bacterium]
MNRSIYCCVLLAALLPTRTWARLESIEVTLDYIAKKAEQRAQKPFHSPRGDLPDVLRQDKLDYDKYREIEFRHEKALWSSDNLPFRAEFFHPGYLYQEPVHINEFTLTAVQPVRFVQDFFNYRSLTIQKQIPANTGYAGFRLLCELNEKGKWDELGAFLGASYFRLLGKGQTYGQSARGLALDCGENDRDEEFPLFTDWWLGKPSRDDDRIKLYAILDSVSCAGAYRFTIVPGDTTIADVEAVLYFRDADKVHAVNKDRKPIRTVGLAPLTSMFWFGKNAERRFDDYRPEVHDSDGLLMQMDNGEVLWRSLNNPAPPNLLHQRFGAKDIRGFGLLQRDRNFDDYQDLFNLYQTVPSVWVEPHGPWGEGDINVVELSTSYEGLDNIVAFWDPKEKPKPMKPFAFGYTLYWTLRESDLKVSDNRVAATRVGVDPRAPQRRQFVIDFEGPKLSGIPATSPPQAIASCSTNAAIVDNAVRFNPFNKSWRVMLKLEPQPGNKDTVDIRCTLKKGEEVLSETWTYHWSPP